ncbi:phosphodiester glycosidase family protein [Phormidium tenue FACHB-886]|nr:phosphodiester glycosidase family protein [Phormidium tenue FACHB-886]
MLFFLTHSPKSASSLTSSPPATTSTAIRPALNQPPEYETYTLDRAIVHTVLISAQSQYQVIPAVTPGIATLKDFAEPYQAIAVINGGFFDPANQQSTSYVMLQGRIAADPQQNDRLTNNPDLAPYLDKIFNRSEFRQYQCGQAGSQTLRHDIALHKDAPPAGCQLVNALGAGPRLLPDLNLQSESFLETAADGSILRDPIDHNRLSPRSAIGITADGSVILVMAAQKPGLPDGSGLTLQELANFMKSLGVQKALNLDGGGSASLYFDGTTYYGKLDEAGNPIERPVKSVLLVK